MAVNWNLSLRLRDSKQGAAPLLFNAQLATAVVDKVAGAQAAANTLIPLVDAVTQSQIVSAIASFELSLPGGLKSSATAGFYNTTVGNINYSSNSPGDGWTMSVPNILNALIQPGGALITNVTPLAALTTLLVDQTAGNPNYWTDEDRNFLAAFFWGSKGTRKYRRAYGVRPQRDRAIQ